MLRSKIHRAKLTASQLDYEGSIAIDRDLLQAADMLPGEQGYEAQQQRQGQGRLDRSKKP